VRGAGGAYGICPESDSVIYLRLIRADSVIGEMRIFNKGREESKATFPIYSHRIILYAVIGNENIAENILGL
jgi:hypothetical protein